MTGHLGKPSSGMNPLRGQNNVQGANDAGATPVFFPGYQRVDDPEVIAKYEKSWGVRLDPAPGMNLNVMMKEVGKKIRGLYVMGEDILLSEPNVSRLEEGMNQIDFLVLQDAFMNETARFADVILPAAVFAEKDGTFTNSERRVQRVRKAVEPPGKARPDWEIVVDLANAVGAEWKFDSAADVYAEMVRDAPKFSGISHERVDREGGLQWPCPTPDHPGTRFLHEGGVLRGKGQFQAVHYRPSEELPDQEYTLVLSTGRTPLPLQRGDPDATRVRAQCQAAPHVRADPSLRRQVSRDPQWRARRSLQPPRDHLRRRRGDQGRASRLHLDPSALCRSPRHTC